MQSFITYYKVHVVGAAMPIEVYADSCEKGITDWLVFKKEGEDVATFKLDKIAGYEKLKIPNRYQCANPTV